ncbi:MAG: hypothetical protein QW625_02515 [Candidatus Nanoarchaeia archaeon]
MHGPHSGRTGTCVYCGKLSIAACSLCGALVCKEHYHKATGLCIACLSGRKAKS